MRVTDRSRCEVDWRCPRARYYLTEWGHHGLVRNTGQLELQVGTDLHNAMQQLALRRSEANVQEELASGLGRDVYQHVLELEGEQAALDLSCISEGLFRGFATTVWPRWLQEFDIVAIEQECLIPLRPDLTFMARPDLIVRRKSTGENWYIEYKSTSMKDSRWINSWNKAVQLHAGCLAVEQTLKIPMSGCYVQGLYKGYKDKKRDPIRFVSPFSVGYRKMGVPGILETKYSYNYISGWEKFSPREVGLAEWVNMMPGDLLAEQFPITPPIMIRRDLVDQFLQQTINREAQIELGKSMLMEASEIADQQQALITIEQILNTTFPQKFNQCEPVVGSPCSYREACWLSHVADDPFGSGYFKERDPHHELEQQLLSEVG
jgi:hypothetical protein